MHYLLVEEMLVELQLQNDNSFNFQEFYEFNLCNQSLKNTFDDCDCLPFDSFFRAVFFN